MFLFIHRNFITGIFMSNFNYNTVIPQYNTNLYSGNYVPTNSDWLLSPAQNTVTSPVQGDSFTSSSKGNDGKFDYSIDDGKISFGDKLKNFGKGLISPITNMFSSPKNFLIGVGMVAAGAALMIGTAGAAAPILVALGVTAGAVQLGTGAYKAATAKTDAEAEAAWQGIGAGTTSVGLSVLGAKSSLKAAGFADDAANMNMLQATAKCFKVAPGQFGKSVANVKLTLGIKPKTTSPKTEPKSVDTMESKVEPKAEPKTEPKPAEKPKSAEQTQSAEQPSAAKEKSITKQEHAQRPVDTPEQAPKPVEQPKPVDTPEQAPKLTEQKPAEAPKPVEQPQAAVGQKPVKVIDLDNVSMEDAKVYGYKGAKGAEKSFSNLAPDERPDMSFLKDTHNKTYDSPDLKLVQDYSKQPYDLSERFTVVSNNTAQAKGSATIVNEVPDVFKGIDTKVLSNKLDTLSAVLDGKAINKFTIDGKEFSATRIGSGQLSNVYKISDTLGNNVVMKAYRDPSLFSSSGHGAYGEIALAGELGKAGVVDVPKMYMANPIGKYVNVNGNGAANTYGSWQLTEYITDSTPLKTGGKTFLSWLSENKLSYGDFNEGSKVGNYFVDLGGIVGEVTRNNSSSDCIWLLNGYRNGETGTQMLSALAPYLN